MLKRLYDFLKKKETLLKRKEPLFYDTDEFFRQNAPHLASDTFPLKYYQGVLVVGVRSSAALQEFFFVKKELLEFLREKKYSVYDITTRYVGKV